MWMSLISTRLNLLSQLSYLPTYQVGIAARKSSLNGKWRNCEGAVHSFICL